MEKEVNSIIYRFEWADQASKKFISDFLEVERNVFGGFDMDLVNRKHIHNIFGPSLLTVAYLGDKPVGADTMIRNDINGKIVYESADTCVLAECRGKQVFSNMKKGEIEIIGTNHPIYGFPNHNSYPGFVKMGWNVQCLFHPTIFTTCRRYNKEYPEIIDFKYAQWLASSSFDYHYVKIWNEFYLVYGRGKKLHIVGRLSKEATTLFKRASRWNLLIYKTSKKRFYHSTAYRGSIITYGDCPQIPAWRSDGFIN